MNFAPLAAKIAEAKLEKAQSVVAAKAAQLDEAYHISEKAGEAKAAVTEKAGEAKAAARCDCARGLHRGTACRCSKAPRLRPMLAVVVESNARPDGVIGVSQSVIFTERALYKRYRFRIRRSTYF
jgi:hypothetical protein